MAQNSRNTREEILTVDMVAEWLMCSRHTVIEAIHSGRLVAGRLGRCYRIKASEVLAFLDSAVSDWDGWAETPPKPKADDHGHNLGDGWDCLVCAKYRRLKREANDAK